MLNPNLKLNNKIFSDDCEQRTSGGKINGEYN